MKNIILILLFTFTTMFGQNCPDGVGFDDEDFCIEGSFILNQAIDEFSDDETLVDESSTTLVTERAIKGYVDNEILWVSIAGENLNAGDPVYVYDDAGVAKVKKVFTDMGDVILLDVMGYEIANATIDTNVVVTLMRDRSNSYLKAQVVNIETGQKGTALTLQTGTNYYIDCCMLDTNKFVAIARYGSRIRAIACSVDPVTLSITKGTMVQLDNIDGYYGKVCRIDDTRFAVTWRRNQTPYDAYIIISSVDGALVITPDAGGAVTLNTNYSLYYPICGYSEGHLVVIYRGSGYDIYAKATPIAVAPGTNMAPFGSGNGTLLHAGTAYPYDLFGIGNSKWITLFRDGNPTKAHVFTNTGTLISVGNTTQMSEFYSYMAQGVAVDIANSKFIGVFTNNTQPYDGRYKIGTTPLDLITFSSQTQLWNRQVYKIDVSNIVDEIDWVVAVALIESVTYNTYVFKLGSLGNQFRKCIGIAEEAALVGEPIQVTFLYGITEQISGVAGETMYIQDDKSITNILSDYPIAKMIDTNKSIVGKEF